MLDAKKALMDNFVGLAEVISEDLNKMVTLYRDGKVDEALERGEFILNGFLALSDNPLMMIGLSTLYPPAIKDTDRLDQNISIN